MRCGSTAPSTPTSPGVASRHHGSEFISRDLHLWAYVNDGMLDFSRPGKPTNNAYIESFNGKFRAECLNQHCFLTLDDARQKMGEWPSHRLQANDCRAMVETTTRFALTAPSATSRR